ncbi:MAG: TrkH family potassium uptake protein [Candidatus Thermoplasmatota archaeon]|nr:TrkH family potassium uptake protein [Candidatus Thermoplasmatota archaeon]
MRFKKALSGIGAVLLIYPIAFLLPFIVGILYGETTLFLLKSYLLPALLSFLLGMFLINWGKWVPHHELDLRSGEALVVVSLTWLFIAALGAFPFLLTGTLVNYVDAFFESMSGFTTTGASVIVEIDGLPHSILIWRSLTQWLGGLGVIVLMVAIFSLLMGGPKAGMLLMKGEVPGHSSEKIVHRIKDAAKILWTIYLILTIAEIILLTILGLSLFDATCHSLTTLSTGGYGTHNASIAYYQNLPTAPLIELVFVFFMFMGGVNFVLHYNFIGKGVRSYLMDREFKVYVFIMLTLVSIVTLDLTLRGGQSVFSSIRASLFTIVSLQTTTGYVTADYETWSSLSKLILLIAMFFGGMTGSTGGGMKIARFIIAYQAAKRSLKRIGHPRSVIPLRMGNVIFSERIVSSVLTFIFAYISIFVFSSFIMTLTGLDAVSALSSVAATLGNVGPGLGLVGPTCNYAAVEPAGKVILSLLMWLGRLELLAVVVLFFPKTYKV